MKRRVFSLCLTLIAVQGLMAQLTSLGVIEDSVLAEEHYKMLFGGNSLYASSSRGLYQYELNESTNEWRKLEFTDSTILDFEVRGDTIVALSGQLLYISTDAGRTANHIPIDSIDPNWNKNYFMRALRGLALHPSDAKKIHVSLSWGGLFYSDDGGLSWVEIDSVISPPYLRYNPLDAKYMIGYGTIYVDVSRDGGFSWERRLVGRGGRIVHDVAFHPTNKWRIVACGDLYAMSNDGGYEWRMIGSQSPPLGNIVPAAYLYDVVYDSRDPDILYGADETEYRNNRIPILRSTDGGFTWETFYVIETSEPTGVFNMCMKDNLLAIYTLWVNQVYLLDVDSVNTNIASAVNEKDATAYYDLQGRPVSNPTRGIYIKDGKKVVIK
ncbi:MAG: hypothetical protein IKK87_04235 [Bacteroidaceae bacterium]|nr:hypothetical protein [Bacteroidaceae bacterium]